MTAPAPAPSESSGPPPGAVPSAVAGARTAVAGGTGFTGRRVVRLLLERGAAPVCLVRPGSDATVLPPGVATVGGDLADPDALDRWLHGCRSLVWCASMGQGHVPAAVAACERAGVDRAVFVSTTAIFTSLPASSRSVRQEAESAVLRSRLRWTLLRPTMIYGAPGDRNLERLLRYVRQWPAIPVPGGGRARLQPVHVDDLAQAVVAAWSADGAVGRAYAISGPEPVTFDALIDAAAAACGRRVMKVHLPLGPVAWGIECLEGAGIDPGIRSEQVRRLAEDKAFSHEDAARDLGFSPRALAAGLAEEARALGIGGP